MYYGGFLKVFFLFFFFTGVASSVSIFSSIWYLFLVSVGPVGSIACSDIFSSRKRTGLSEVIPLCGVLPSFPLFVQFECWWADWRSLLFNIILHGLSRFRSVLLLNRSVQFWRGLVWCRYRCPLILSILPCEGLYISRDFPCIVVCSVEILQGLFPIEVFISLMLDPTTLFRASW